MEKATGKFGLDLINERGDTLVEWATPRKYNITNSMFQMKTGRRWTSKSPNGVTKTEIYYILTNRPDIVTDVAIINQVSIESDHRNGYEQHQTGFRGREERIDCQEATKSLCHTNMIKEDQIPSRIDKKRFKTLLELDDIDTMSEAITDMIQQSASRVATAITKPLKSRISSPTRALMTKRREMVEIGDDKQRIEYAEICVTIKKKARQDNRK